METDLLYSETKGLIQGGSMLGPGVSPAETQEIFRLLVDSVQDYAIFALDITGKIVTWNSGARRLKGYAAEDVIGTHFSRFYTDEDRDRNHPAFELREALKNGRYEEEGWRIRKDGSRFWANVVITPLRDKHGEIRGFSKVTRDLSDRRKADLALKESEERFRLLVSNVSDYAIITLDPRGYITSWNSGAERIKGYRPKEIIGKHFSSFYPVSEIENGKPEMELRVAADEGSYEEEGWRVRKDGTMFWANVTITPMREEDGTGHGKLKGFAKVTRDLTSRRQSEEALRQSQERYRLLVDNISDYGLIFLDSKGRITSWNSGASLITGYEYKEILGANFAKIYSKQEIEEGVPAQHLRIATDSGKYMNEALRFRKDGTEYWATSVLACVRDEYGNVRGYSLVTRDDTAKKNADALFRESEERFRLMVESVEDYAVFMLDPDGRIATWNKGAERNKGYKAHEIIGQHFSKFYPEVDVAAGKPAFELEEAIRVGKFEDEGWRVRKDGTMFWANVVITVMRDKSGKVVGFSKVTRNLTERKRAEDELRAAYADLEVRIEARTRELSAAKAKAEAAVKARDEFFSIASHELKTPLASLKLQSQIRKRNVQRGNLKDFAPENLAELCADDERQVDRLSFLVNNLFDIAKLTKGSLDLALETFELDGLLREITKQMAPTLTETDNSLTLKANGAVRVTWDRMRIGQVISNFLSNAGKYAPGTPVQVSAINDGEKVFIRISDRGPGIQASDQSRVFLPFERVRTKGDIEGLGLGLYIAKQIVEAHQGSIEIESEVGKGATFVISLPVVAKLPEEK